MKYTVSAGHRHISHVMQEGLVMLQVLKMQKVFEIVTFLIDDSSFGGNLVRLCAKCHNVRGT